MAYCKGHGFHCENCSYDNCVDERGKYEKSSVEIRLYDHDTDKFAYKRLSIEEWENIKNNIYIKWD